MENEPLWRKHSLIFRINYPITSTPRAPTRLATLLSSAGKSRPKVGSKIPVNRVSITRRQGKITRGSGRMAGGRKANVSVAAKLLKRARERRPNDLGRAVANRRPNATGHNVKSK